MRDETREYYRKNTEGETARTDASLRERFAARLSASASILDAGCGNGADLIEFRRMGFQQLTGIDSSPEMAAQARRCTTATILETDLRFYSPPPGSFDAIWANDLLSAFEPTVVQRIMGVFFAALKPSGVLMINARIGEHGVITHDSERPHLLVRTFSEPALDSLILQSGFVTEEKARRRSENWVAWFCRRIGASETA